ncbi:SET methyltransferase domain containing protein [Nitzschia inconspicua]|uniref:SET methyltransferase domain containing protein n=1 Tax=Nitzschia inconspicua TaxID=303405 RepID=A0A9K3PXQ1_9STRA|nr:SET methyltransferase domain containing protein [Nitzschia inconspicua]
MDQSAISQNDDGSDEEEDYIFGVDFSKFDVSEVRFDEGDEKLVNNDSNCVSKQQLSVSFHCAKLVQYQWTDRKHNIFDTNDRDIQKLFAWAEAQGANLAKITCCQDAFDGNGLCLKGGNIAAGSVVAVLPRSLRIGQNHACQKLGLKNSTPDLSALSLLLVDALMADDESEICHSKDNGLTLYAKCLPRHCHNAVFMTDDDLEYWGRLGQKYVTNIRKVQDQATSCMHYIQDCILPPDISRTVIIRNNHSLLLKWAIAMVQSRTHSFGSHKCRWLTPIFDFCNHSVDPNCRLEGDAQGNLILRATTSIQQGEEITIDYQVSDDAKLVATYGFSLLHRGPT